MSIKAIIFDYGQVLTYPQNKEYINEMIKSLNNISFDKFHHAYYEHRDVYDGGKVNGVDYWKLVVETLGIPSFDESTLKWLVKTDLDSWYFQNPDMWNLALKLRQNYKTALLSNNLDELVVRMEKELELDKYFDEIVFSYRVDMVKPDRRIYEYCLNRLNLAPQETVFIDDRLVNIEGAEKLGINSILFTDYDKLLKDLEKFSIILK